MLEELRSILSLAIKNPKEVQFCKLLSVEQCDSYSVYLDIDLNASDPDHFLDRHIAHDWDVCLLASKPLGDKDFDASTCSLGIVVGVGCDTFFSEVSRSLSQTMKNGTRKI